VLVGKRAEAGREHDHHGGRRDVEEPGRERRVAEELHVEREEDERPVQARVDEERLAVRGGEVAAPEECRRKHRLVGTPLDPRERGERRHRDDERPPVAAEPFLGSLDHRICERAEADGGEDSSGQVEVAGPQLTALVAAARSREHDRHGGEREVDEEDPAP
jgi:hypothetical protein